ncbi:MAG: PilZ domain-containing protein [Desulfobacteraceae bacterium]|nr:MAG: PilZ domain-containing protein [Desulfobacteraceae bacterium]
MATEHRRFTRIIFRVKAEVKIGTELYIAKEIKNLSIGGCLLPLDADLEPGVACQIKISLSGSTSDLSVQAEGEIVRSMPGAIAVQFTRIDPDSLYHLQSIVRYNAPDAESFEEEIDKHPGIA